MSHFRAMIETKNGNSVSRIGYKSDVMRTKLQTSKACIQVTMWEDDTGKTFVTICKTPAYDERTQKPFPDSTREYTFLADCRPLEEI